MTSRPAIRPDRVRRIGGQSFAFIPHRLLRDGFLATMTLPERALYLLLVLVADRDGMSFYGYDRICSLLELTLDSYLEARNGLVDKDLIAFDGRRFQVLSLPCSPVQPSSRPLRSTAELHEHDPGTIRQCILESLNAERSDQ
jgi:hypothetical protein